MKKKIILIASLVLLVLLIVRLMVVRVDQREKEKVAFVKDLHYEFSARLDTAVTLNSAGFGIFMVHILHGNADPSVEKPLNKKLKYNADLQFLRANQRGNLYMFTQSVNLGAPGDSISVNTTNDWLAIYRGSKLITECKISDAMASRPF